MIVAIQTPPDVASSNAARWVEWITGYLPDWPQWVDNLVTGIGVLMLVASLLWWWWDRRRNRPATIDDWIHSQPGPPPAPNQAATDHGTRETWSPLDEAIRYLAKGSQWGAGQNQTDPHFPIRLSTELLDALLCGDLSARGRYYHVLRGGIQDPPLHSLKPIDKDFWDGVHIETYFPLQGRIQAIASKGVESAVRKSDHEGLHDVRLNKRQLEALWPPRPAKVSKDEFGEAWTERATDQIPFVRLRDLAPSYGLSLDPHDPNSGNVAYRIEGALRQAAVDGDLQVRGRRYLGPAKFNEPLVAIPPAHFEEYGFAHGYLNYEEANDSAHTGTLRMATEGNRRGIEGVTYYDLHLPLEGAKAVLRKVRDDERG